MLGRLGGLAKLGSQKDKKTGESRELNAWIQRLKDGDQSAFLPFYQRTAPGLLRFLLWKSKGDRPLAEDILQESYVRFLLNLDRLESTADLAVQSYLLRIAKNCLIDKAVRTPQASRQHVPIDSVLDLNDGQGSSRQERAVEMRELSIAMQNLSERESEIIYLRDAMGLSHREVADEVGLTEQASRQAYVRAKRSLMSELMDQGGGGNVVAELS